MLITVLTLTTNKNNVINRALQNKSSIEGKEVGGDGAYPVLWVQPPESASSLNTAAPVPSKGG